MDTLVTVKRGVWHLVAPATLIRDALGRPLKDAEGKRRVECELHDELDHHRRSASEKKHVDGVLRQCVRVAEDPRGTRSLHKEVCHEAFQIRHAGRDVQIFSVRVGNLRLLYFSESDRLIVCMACVLKRSQKWPPGVQARAQRLYGEYVRDVQPNLDAIRQEMYDDDV